MTHWHRLLTWLLQPRKSFVINTGPVSQKEIDNVGSEYVRINPVAQLFGRAKEQFEEDQEQGGWAPSLPLPKNVPINKVVSITRRRYGKS